MSQSRLVLRRQNKSGLCMLFGVCCVPAQCKNCGRRNLPQGEVFPKRILGAGKINWLARNWLCSKPRAGNLINKRGAFCEIFDLDLGAFCVSQDESRVSSCAVETSKREREKRSQKVWGETERVKKRAGCLSVCA